MVVPTPGAPAIGTCVVWRTSVRSHCAARAIALPPWHQMARQESRATSRANASITLKKMGRVVTLIEKVVSVCDPKC